MKTGLLFLLLILIFSQSSSAQVEKTDSLISQFKKVKTASKKCSLARAIVSEIKLSDKDIFRRYIDSICYYSNLTGVESDKAYCLRARGSALQYIDYDLEAALLKLQEALSIFSVETNQRDIVLTLKQLGAIHMHLSKSDSSKWYYTKALEVLDKAKAFKHSEKIRTNLLYEVGLLERATGNFNLAAQFVQKSLTNAQINDDLDGESAALYLLGDINIALGKKSSAMKFYKDAIVGFKKLKNYTFVGAIYNGMARAVAKKDFEKKISFNLLSIHFLKKGSRQNQIAMVYCNTANNYLKSGKRNISKLYLDSGISLSLKYQDDQALAQARKIKANILIKEKNYAAAGEVLENVLNYYEESKYKRKQLMVLMKLGNVYYLAKQYKTSADYLKRAITINHEVFSEKTASELQRMETKYQSEKKEKENLKLRAETAEKTLRIRKEKQTRYYVTSALLLTLLTLGTFGFYFRRSKKQQNKIVTLQKELHHRIENNLAIIDGFIEKSMEDVKDENVLDNLNELQSRVASINALHNLLHKDDDVTVVNLKLYIQALVDRVQKIYNQKIQVNISCSPLLNIDTQKSVHFGLIVNEFITNSFKYAFKDIENPALHISVRPTEQGWELTMHDNGPGFTDHNFKRGYGTRIMELLAQKINAAYKLSGVNGTSLSLSLTT